MLKEYKKRNEVMSMIQIILLGFLIGFMLGIILVTGYYIVHYHSKKIKQYSFGLPQKMVEKY